MLVLIAESKTMTACAGQISPEIYGAHTPRFENRADELMLAWSGMTVQELAAEIKISPTLARSMKEMIMTFPDKAHGARAIEAYTGVVFKALDYSSFTTGARERLGSHTAIISSLYGLLSPNDIIKAYRLDFTTRLAPGAQTMATYWKPAVTSALIDLARTEGSGEILDLLPADAAKCVDWKAVSHAAEVCKVDFRSTDSTGKLRTPHAGLLKTLRGELLRQIVTDDIRTLAELRSLSGKSSTTATIAFEV